VAPGNKTDRAWKRRYNEAIGKVGNFKETGNEKASTHSGLTYGLYKDFSLVLAMGTILDIT
jgi:hypothetical protein